MPSKHHTVEFRCRENERLMCKAEGCLKTRARVGGFCANHSVTNNLFGHPLHKMLCRSHYKGELQDVTEIIQKNLEHPGVVYALRWVELLLQGSVRIPKEAKAEYKTEAIQRELVRLYNAGVEPLEVLTEAAALYRLYDRGYSKRILSQRHLLYMIGLRVCCLRPPGTGNYPAGPVRRGIGTAINKQIGPLLLNISRSVDEKTDAVQREMAAMYEPMKV